MKAWYFSTTDKKLRYGDGREIALGVTHTVEGKPVPCRYGLHGSVRTLDAVRYAPGPIIWEVELGGEIVEGEDHDKHAATERTYLRGGVDVSETLRAFARWAALSVARLWDIPDVVRQYLETGDASLANTAAYAANTAAYAAAYAAANAAANAANAAANAAYAAANAAKEEEMNTKLLEMIEAAIAKAEGRS